MQQNKELDYEKVYNGKGREIQEMIIEHFSSDSIKLKYEKEVMPDRPDRDNIVGLKLIFELKDGYDIVCTINKGVTLGIKDNGVNQRYISEIMYLTFEKKEELGFSYADAIIQEKLLIIDQVLTSLRNGENIKRVDIAK